MGIHPEMVKVVVADPVDKTGKAEERQALMRVCPRPPGALAPACPQEHVHELGRSLWALVKKVVFEEGIISPAQSEIGTWH